MSFLIPTGSAGVPPAPEKSGRDARAPSKRARAISWSRSSPDSPRRTNPKPSPRRASGAACGSGTRLLSRCSIACWPAPRPATRSRFAGELAGQLDRDPGRRFGEGLALLRSPAVSQRAKFLMEGSFLARLLDGAGQQLPELLPSFGEIAADLGSHAQLVVAKALGKACRGRDPLPTEFLGGALRAERMDLAGAFLRAAGRDYLGRLDGRRHGELIRALKKAWQRPSARLDLAPFGEAIGRLEERR